MKKGIGILIMAGLLGLFGCATSPKQREAQAEKLLSQKYGEEIAIDRIRCERDIVGKPENYYEVDAYPVNHPEQRFLANFFDGEEKVDRDTYLCRKVCIQLENAVEEELSKQFKKYVVLVDAINPYNREQDVQKVDRTMSEYKKDYSNTHFTTTVLIKDDELEALSIEEQYQLAQNLSKMISDDKSYIELIFATEQALSFAEEFQTSTRKNQGSYEEALKDSKQTILHYEGQQMTTTLEEYSKQ